MKRFTILAAMALGTVLPLSSVMAAAADSIDDPNTVDWSSIRGYSSQDFSTYFNQKKAQGYRVIDIEVDTLSGQPRYSAVWQYNTDKRGWASLRNLTHEQFSQKWKSYRDQGYRLIDQEAYSLDGQRRYAGVWVQNKENLPWVSFRNVDTNEFASKFNTYKEQGYRIIDIEAYPSGNTTQYSAIWIKESNSPGWAEYRDMSEASYAQKFKDFAKQGYRVMDFESYRSNGQQQYAAIWVKNTNGRGWAARRDMTATWFGNYWKTYRDEGYRLVDFEAYPTSQGTRYAGVWRQNGSRLNWSHKTRVDEVVEAYRSQNGVPGISVAVAENGKIVYSRGFGFADVSDQKVAHSDTVYRLASVSKPVTALLAMQLQDKNQLNIDQASRTYAPSLPNHHTHTVRQLLKHQSGIRHYRGSDRPDCLVPNNPAWKDSSNTQYPTAVVASQLFQSDPLMFAPGSKTCYSTHAYTVLGAALEGASNRSYATLLQQELSGRLNLPTLRPEYLSQSVAERAEIYSSATSAASRDNLSWKYPGGGLEASVNDLTQLGIKVIDGSAVSSNARTGLWSGSTFSHSGSQNGAKSYWRMYFSGNKVITILSNRSNGSPEDLADTIGDLIN
ncbi:MAG: serine hydrolase [Thermosynechococcaceae cyanobacterium]